MNKVIVLAVVAFLGWYGYSHYQRGIETAGIASPATAIAPAPEAQFKCDGRIHCSQMTSCEEATYFLRNCPGTKMDGDNDGIPCEKQWC